MSERVGFFFLMVHHYVVVFVIFIISICNVVFLLQFDGFVTRVFPICSCKQVRVSGFGGWFLLRLSLHDPVLPLNIEVDESS